MLLMIQFLVCWLKFLVHTSMKEIFKHNGICEDVKRLSYVVIFDTKKMTLNTSCNFFGVENGTKYQETQWCRKGVYLMINPG